MTRLGTLTDLLSKDSYPITNFDYTFRYLYSLINTQLLELDIFTWPGIKHTGASISLLNTYFKSQPDIDLLPILILPYTRTLTHALTHNIFLVEFSTYESLFCKLLVCRYTDTYVVLFMERVNNLAVLGELGKNYGT